MASPTVVRQWREVPTYTTPVSEKGNTTTSYYRFLHDINIGNPPAAEASITVGASPFSYTAPRGGVVIVYGGSVSVVSFTRVGTYTTGQTQGMFTLGAGDILTVTYSGAPTMTFAPL